MENQTNAKQDLRHKIFSIVGIALCAILLPMLIINIIMIILPAFASKLSSKLSLSINTFYFIWDSFDFEKIIVTKYDAYRILKDILNLKNLDKINNDLNNRFYENEDLKIKRITQKTLFDF